MPLTGWLIGTQPPAMPRWYRPRRLRLRTTQEAIVVNLPGLWLPEEGLPQHGDSVWHGL